MFEIHDYTNPDVAGSDRSQLEKRFGVVWDTDQLRADFDVHGFSAPFVVVTRKRDGVKGSLEFTHSPRFYFNFVEDKPHA